MVNLNMLDSIEEDGEREEQDYSIVIYIVKKGDTLLVKASHFMEFAEVVEEIITM